MSRNKILYLKKIDILPPPLKVDDDCAYPPPLVESLVHRMPPDHKGAVCG